MSAALAAGEADALEIVLLEASIKRFEEGSEMRRSLFVAMLVLLAVPQLARAAGDRVLFLSVRADSGRELYAVDRDGSGLVRLTYNDVHESQPVWSPDRTRIAFSGFATAAGTSIQSQPTAPTFGLSRTTRPATTGRSGPRMDGSCSCGRAHLPLPALDRERRRDRPGRASVQRERLHARAVARQREGGLRERPRR